jgi:hypothetical protein
MNTQEMVKFANSQYTTSFEEGILQGIMSRINDYVAKLVDRETDTSTFQVFLLNTPTIDMKVKELPCKISHPIPFFSRIRSVTVDQTGTMFCSCKHFERMGLPCGHMACVAKLCHETKSFGSITCKFSGFTHHDIAVRWWSSYMYYVYRSSTPSHIIEKYCLLAMNPIKGPKTRCNVTDTLEI